MPHAWGAHHFSALLRLVEPVFYYVVGHKDVRHPNPLFAEAIACRPDEQEALKRASPLPQHRAVTHPCPPLPHIPYLTKSQHIHQREMRPFSLARATSGLMATTALLFLLAGAPTTQALDAADAKNLTRIGYIYTYPIMLTYRQMYADVLARGPPYNFNQFFIQDKLPDFKVGRVRPPSLPIPPVLLRPFWSFFLFLPLAY